MSNLFDAQTKDVIESRMAQTLHTITEKEQSTMEGTFAQKGKVEEGTFNISTKTFTKAG